MSERETRDFMSVESFSQLPFIRREKFPDQPNPPIRLFGIDFPPDSSAISENSTTTADHSPAATNDAGTKKFECHYCFRNFPTSQALGGHQNAHKRERQHAKRAYLSETHFHGPLGYHRFGMPTPSFDPPPQLYPSWSLSGRSVGGGPFYGGLGSVVQPISGNPVQGPWRAPPAAVTTPFPLFRGVERKMIAGGSRGVGSSSSSSSTASPRDWCGHEAKDGVISLDLHL